jgi:hypothetical protein
VKPNPEQTAEEREYKNKNQKKAARTHSRGHTGNTKKLELAAAKKEASGTELQSRTDTTKSNNHPSGADKEATPDPGENNVWRIRK